MAHTGGQTWPAPAASAPPCQKTCLPARVVDCGPAIESVETSTEQTARRPKGGVSNQVCQTVKSARAKCENEPTAQVRLPA